MSKQGYIDFATPDTPIKFWKLALLAFLLGVFVGSYFLYSRLFGFITQFMVH